MFAVFHCIVFIPVCILVTDDRINDKPLMHALHARLTADYLKNANSAKAQGVKD